MKKIPMMKCVECESNSFSFDDRLGEQVCDDCGLVMITEPFEQNSYSYDANGQVVREAWKLPSTNVIGIKSWGKTDRAIHTGIAMCKILLSSLSSSSALRERVETLYRELYRKHVFTTSTLEDRSAALVYYILRECNLPYTLEEVCREYDCISKRVFKLSKKIALEMNNTTVFLMNDSRPFAEKYASRIGNPSFVSKVGRLAVHYDVLVENIEENLRPSSPAAFCYIVSLLENNNISQKSLSDKTGFSTRTIYRETERLLKLKNTNKNKIIGKGIEWIEIY
tara:strand:- start:14 stop:856 length:843 start_codon:yes stop_codon:yes gene_type:complete